MKFYLQLTLCILTSLITNAQISLFKDINTSDAGSNPANFIELNGTVFFIAQNNLWKTDGTETGTVKVSDQSVNNNFSNRKFIFLTTDTHLYYGVVNSDSSFAIDIWKTDGVTNTLVVENIGYTSDLIALNNVVYYLDYNGLYRINASGGSTLVKSLGYNSDAKASVINNEILFFSENYYNTQLWKSDGTESGTVILHSFDAKLLSIPGGFVKNDYSITINNSLFFLIFKQNYQSSRFEGYLWKSDGTSAGTVLVKQVLNSITYTQQEPANNLIDFNGELAFNVGNDLWISDGTETGTQLLKTFQGFNSHGYKRNLGVLGNKFFFSASDANNDYELWESDGTVLGTKLLKDLHPNQSSKPDFFVSFNNRLIFRANGGKELWQSDGTAAGTSFVMNIPKFNPNIDVKPEFIITSNQTIFFQNYDFQHNAELWKSDGTPQNTGLLKNIATGTSGSNIDKKIKVGNIWYFSATDYRGLELWKSDGTPEGTTIVKDINTGPADIFIEEMVSLGDILYFTGRIQGDYIRRLWRTDGTEANTIEIDLNFNNNGVGVNPFALTVANNKLFFMGERVGVGMLIWTLDGTQARMLTNTRIYPSIPQNLIGVGNKLFFTSDGLWESDGTEAGTKRVHNLSWNTLLLPIEPKYLIEFKNKLYFFSYFSTENGVKDGLFEVSGINNETKLIKEFASEEFLTSGYWPSLEKTKDRLYFSTNPTNLGDGKQSIDLWTSDATTNGTFKLKTLVFDSSWGLSFMKTDTTLFITNNSLSFNTRNIWATNGTTAGTILLHKTPTGNFDTGVSFNNKIYFSMHKASSGSELWTSDGTSIGTYLVEEMLPGKQDPFVGGFMDFEDKIIFWGGDALYGREPRKYTAMNCEGKRNYSIKSGSWDSPDTWSCGHIPTQNDVVIIKAGHRISVPANYKAYTNIFLTEYGAILDIPVSSILISSATTP